MKKLIVIILVVLISGNLYSAKRKVTLFGKVNDEITGEPLEGVEITIPGTEKTTKTDRNGEYDITFPAGEYDVEFKLKDYKKIEKHIKLNSGRKKLNVELLNYNIFIGEEIVVTAKQPAYKKPDVSKETFSSDEIKQISGPKEDVFEAIKILPGIAIMRDFTAEFAVRGGDPDETGVFLDDSRVASPFHLELTDSGLAGGIFTVFNNDMIENVTLYSGGFPAEFGDAMSGVIEIEGKKAGQGKRRRKASISIIDAKFFFDIPSGEKLGIMVAGRRNYMDLLLGLVMQSSDDDQNEFVFPSFWDVHLRVDYAPCPGDRFTAYLLPTGNYMWINFTAEDVKMPEVQGGAVTDIDMKLKWDTGGLLGYTSWEHVFNDRLTSLVTLSHNSKSWDYFQKYSITEPVLNLDTYQRLLRTDTGIKAELIYSPGNSHNIKAGIERKPTYMDLDIQVPINLEFTAEGYDVTYKKSVYNLSSYFLSGYLQDSWQIAERLYADMGVRYDYFKWNDDDVVSPRISVSYGITEKLTARAAWGHFYQFPSISDMVPEFGGNVDLGALKSEHKIISLEKEIKPNTTLKLEIFRKEYSNLVSADFDRVIDPDNEIYTSINEGTGYAHGAEVFFKGRLSKKLSGWISYTMSEAKKIERREKDMVFFNYDRPHILTVLVNFKPRRRLHAGITWRYFSGTPYTPLYKDKEISPGRWDYFDGETNSARLADYYRMDVRLSKDYIYRTWEMTAYVEVINLFNYKNESRKFWNEYKGEMVTGYSLPLIPFFGVEARF